MLKRTKHPLKRTTRSIRRTKVTTTMMLLALQSSGDNRTARWAKKLSRMTNPKVHYTEVGNLLKAVLEGDYACALARSNWSNYQALCTLRKDTEK